MRFRKKFNCILTLMIAASIRLLGHPSSDAVLKYDYSDSAVTIQVPASRRSMLVDVVEVELTK